MSFKRTKHYYYVLIYYLDIHTYNVLIMFIPEEMNIRQALGDTQSYYCIPDYQRPYSWDDDQVYQLWDDLYEAWENSKEIEESDGIEAEKDKETEYFLGSVVLTKYDNHKNLAHYEIIDGQQRLITLVILFCVLRDMISSERITISNQNNIDTDDIKELIVKKKNNRITIRSHSSEYTTFYNSILHEVDIDAKGLNKKEKKEKRKKNKFFNTAQIFCEKIREFNNPDELMIFISYILAKVKLITLTCEDRRTAIKIFQTLNARGLNLNTADLIKSYLFSCVKKSEEEDSEVIKTEWTKLENTINSIDINVENILQYYAYFIYEGDIPKELYESLTSKDSKFAKQAEKKAITALSNIQNFANQYDGIRSSNDRSMYSLTYLRQQLYWRTILTSAAYKKSIKESTLEWPDLAFSLRRFYYLYWIAGHNINKVKQISFNMIKYIATGKSINFINDELNKKLENDRVIKNVWDALESEDVYGSKWLKPLLITIEMEIHEEEAPVIYREMDKKIHIEHILPEKHEQHKEAWEGLTNKKEKLHSLANLTLLSGKKNIAASNKPFKQKLEENYLGNDGKGQDGDTNFVMTRDLKDYEQDGWNDKAYQERSKWLKSQIKKILKI